jgi:long-chain acyl-CoA synthetase
MAGLLDDIVAVRANEPAVVDANGTTTNWSELHRRANRLVHALRARGLRSGDSVVAMLGNQVHLVEVSLACMQAGWLLVPVNWHWVAEELAYVLGDADAAAFVVDARWLPVAIDALAIAPTPGLRVSVAVDCEAAEFELYEALLAAAPDSELAETERGGPMFYTSGTTGRPKGVRSALSQVGGPPEVFTLMARSMRSLLELPAAGRGVQAICGPMYHSAQWVFGTFALLCGTTLVLQHHFDADELLELVDRHAVTNLHLVPAQMVRLLELPVERRERFKGASLRALLHGAAPCRPDVKRRMIRWLGPIVTEYYGGTEGGFISTISAGEWLDRPGSVGKPVRGIEVVVMGEAGEPLGPDEQGDLYFRNAMGSDFEYHKAPDKTASAHLTGGLATLGDIGYIDEHGYLYLSDRRIDMIVSGGVNIYPAEIEGVLAEHDAVTDVAVFGIPDREMGEQVKAAVSLAPSYTWNGGLEVELMALCRARLAGYKCPRTFDVHAKLPRNEAGKLTKRVLRDPYWTGEGRSI